MTAHEQHTRHEYKTTLIFKKVFFHNNLQIKLLQ